MGEIIDKTKGNIKEKTGELTGNDKLKREGQKDQFVGDVKAKAEDAKHAVKDAVHNARDHRQSDHTHQRH